MQLKHLYPGHKMLCISRYTDDTYAQQFGDERHKFYLEFRCNRPCIKGMECCAKCAEKSDTKLQTSRKFNHGNVNEPIPDNSHIFGGKWYYEAVKKWSSPPSEIIEFALAYQKDARGEFIVEQPTYDTFKSKKQPITQEIPMAEVVIKNIASLKHSKKPKVAQETHIITEEAKPIKRAKKPKVAINTEVDAVIETVVPVPKKKIQRKKAPITPYSTLIRSMTPLVHKEISLPTHIETNLEEVNIDGYKIEYIKLSTFEVGQVTYFRDNVKNKLYKKIKEKGIGAYIGRWNPDTDSIITDIPDSDDEN